MKLIGIEEPHDQDYVYSLEVIEDGHTTVQSQWAFFEGEPGRNG